MTSPGPESLDPLQPYLPRLIRYWDKDTPGQLHRSVDGSMVFVDISGFTKMSERLARHGIVGAEEVTEVIDNTFGRLLPKAYAYGANLLKFGGDALLLLFTGEGHQVRAAAGAHSMRTELREIGEFETTAGKVRLRMSVGVHSGAFDFFLVGESHREFIVAGPAASRTVEMEGAATAAQILISPDTAAFMPRLSLGGESGPGFLLRRAPPVEELGFRPASTPPVDLAQFIPLALRETLMSADVDPEHRPAAVAFVHFGGFDRVLKEAGGERSAAVLDRLVSAVQEAANNHGVSFLATDIAPDGGKIILTAGVPQTVGNSEEQMLLTARDIIGHAPPELPLQIGINWGDVFAGAVGPSYRRTYTVMGDTVNLAARLMSKAPVGEIYVTAEVLDGSRTTFNFKTPEPFLVKGKKLPIQAFSVGDPEGSRARGGASTSLPIIGRDEELQAIQAAWASAMASRGRVFEIAAEAGMGKTRLLEEFLATSQPDRQIRAECRLYQSATPYFPFRTLLRAAWGFDSADPEETAASLRSLVKRVAPQLEPWLALIGVPLGLDLAESAEVAQLEDQFRPARTMAAVGALLEETGDKPTLFVVEDCHWMDDASRELLAGIISGVERLPWLLVLTRRPGDQGFVAPDVPVVSHFDLQPLDMAEARRLILRASEDSPLLPSQIETLAKRAEGSPLFLIELLDALRRGGDVDRLPHSVEGLIAARIDKLPPADRHLLRRLAVLGAGFRLEHTASVLRESERAPRWQMQSMRRLQEFFTVDESGWIQFRHFLIRDVAYGGLPFKTRKQLHALVGDAIRDSAGDHPESQAELLSVHYSQARRWSEAWRFSRLAGDGAKEIYANLEAATFYRRALTASRNLDGLDPSEVSAVSESLGDVLELAGLFEESVGAFRQATRLVTNPIRRADLLLKRARARARTGAYTTAFRELSIGRRIVTEIGDNEALKARARLTALNAQIRQLQEHPRTALRLAEEAMAEAEAAGEQEALARSYQVLDAAYNMLGQPSKATYSERALEIYESRGDLTGVAIVTNNLGGQAYFEGRWQDALEFYARAQDAFRRAGNEPEAATSGANIGEVLVSQGRLDEAEEVLREAVRILRAHNLLDAAIFAEIQLARLRLQQGDEGAIDMLVALQSEAAQAGQVQSAIEAAIHLALGLVKRSEPQAALDLIAEAERGSEAEAELFGCSLARVRALALAQLGKTEDARAAVKTGLNQAREEGLPYEEALLLITEAELTEETGDRNRLLEEAERLLQRLGVIRTS